MTRFVRDPHLDLFDDARQAAAVADRSQRRLHGEAEAADATLRGALRDLAEQDHQLLLATTVGRSVRGAVQHLAEDHVEVATSTGTAWVRLGAVTVVRVVSGSVAAGGGERTAPAPVQLAAALRAVAEQRTEVEVVFTGGSVARGVATTVGRDVLRLVEPATGHEQLVHLASAAIVQTLHSTGTP